MKKELSCDALKGDSERRTGEADTNSESQHLFLISQVTIFGALRRVELVLNS